MRIKVCCIQSFEEAQIALGHGAHALGFVSDMPSGPGSITDSEIQEIISKVPPTYSTVLLSSRTDPRALVEHQRETGANTLQLVSAISPESLAQLKDALPGISLLKVIHVQNEGSVELASAYSESADAILLDSGSPDARVPELGGTGETHDWMISRKIVETCRLPVFLAGGLSPLNITDAIRIVSPFGVDVCSGLRPEGTLDMRLLRDFVSRAKIADA